MALMLQLALTDGFKKHGEPLRIYTCEREPRRRLPPNEPVPEDYDPEAIMPCKALRVGEVRGVICVGRPGSHVHLLYSRVAPCASVHSMKSFYAQYSTQVGCILRGSDHADRPCVCACAYGCHVCVCTCGCLTAPVDPVLTRVGA